MRTVALASALLLAACAGGSRYRPLGPKGGYTDMRLNERHFRVSYVGYPKMTPEAVNAYALRRAAEITLQAGYPRFFLISDAARTEEISRGGSYTHCMVNGPFVSCNSSEPRRASKTTTTLTVFAASANDTPPPQSDPRINSVFGASVVFAVVHVRLPPPYSRSDVPPENTATVRLSYVVVVVAPTVNSA